MEIITNEHEPANETYSTVILARAKERFMTGRGRRVAAGGLNEKRRQDRHLLAAH